MASLCPAAAAASAAASVAASTASSIMAWMRSPLSLPCRLLPLAEPAKRTMCYTVNHDMTRGSIHYQLFFPNLKHLFYSGNLNSKRLGTVKLRFYIGEMCEDMTADPEGCQDTTHRVVQQLTWRMSIAKATLPWSRMLGSAWLSSTQHWMMHV